jgi:hypothetical protein
MGVFPGVMVAILIMVKPQVVGTPELRLIVRVEHINGRETQVQVPVPVQSLAAILEPHVFLRSRVRYPENQVQEVYKMKVRNLFVPFPRKLFE